MKSINKIILITGLPGSGKTTLAGKNSDPYFIFGGGRTVVHLDDFDGPEDFEIPYVGKNSLLVIEGLLSGPAFFTVMDEVLRKLKTAKNFEKRGRIPVEIVRFNDDIESCHWNDRARGREKDASITINNLKITVPFEELERHYPKFKFKLTRKKVVRAAPAIIWTKENDIPISTYHPEYLHHVYDDGRVRRGRFIVGKEWCLGGTWGNYKGNSGQVAAYGTPQDDFVEFDDLLEKICPDITLPEYRSAKEAAVELVSFRKQDYYGGSTNHMAWVCDLDALYEYLTVNELIEPVKNSPIGRSNE